MDLSLGIAIGSSMQIALFVAPVAMFCSYLFGKPMTLEFSLPEVVAIAISVVVVGQISSDGESNWLEGALLLAVYAVIAGLYLRTTVAERGGRFNRCAADNFVPGKCTVFCQMILEV